MLRIPTFLQPLHDLSDFIACRKNWLIRFQELIDPFFCLERQSLFLSCFYVSVIIEDGQLILCWFLFVLYDKFFNIFASIEKLFAVTETKSFFSPILPALALWMTQRTNSCRIDFHFVIVFLKPVFPTTTIKRKFSLYIVVQENFSYLFILVQQTTNVSQILICHLLAKSRKSTLHCFFLSLIGNSINRNELSTDLNLFEFFAQLGRVHKETLLI